MVSDLINLFLSGFIFMYTYNWLNSKKNDISLITIWGLFISTLIKSFYSAVHTLILSNIRVNDAIKILIFAATGFLLAVLCTYIRRSKLLTKLLYRINNKSANDDIFDDIIDYDKNTMLNVYLKSSDVYYIGRFSFREENGLDSWISLIKYCSVDKKTNNPIFDPEENDLCSSVAINLREIERIEIIYEEDSEVWKRLIDNDNKETTQEKEG